MIRAANDPSVSQSVFTITEKAPTRALFWFKASVLSHLRHYSKQALNWDTGTKDKIRDGQFGMHRF